METTSSAAESRVPIVLLVSDEYPPYTSWGGNAYQMSHLALLLRNAGYRVEIIALSDDGDEFCHLDPHGNLVHRVSPTRSFTIRTAKKVSKYLGRVASRADIPFALRVAEKAYELTTIWRRDILWIEATNWKAQSVVLQLIPSLNRRHAIRIVTPMAEVAVQNQMKASVALRTALGQERLQQMLLRHRFYSNEEYKPYFESRVRTAASPVGPEATEKVFLLPFDFSRVTEVEPKPTAKGEPIRVLMIGRIEPRKGFDDVCSALAELTPEQRARVQIVAVGRDVPMGPLGSYQAMLRTRFGDIVDRFEFHGQVSDEELVELSKTAHVGLVASRSESFGYNLVELIATNLPVITSNVGAATELERRGIRYLLKYDSIPQLGAMLGRLGEALADFRAGSFDNRRDLEAIYRTNDAEYLAYVARQFGPPPERRPYVAPVPPKSADIVICSYNRFDELTVSIGSILTEMESASSRGVDCALTVVYQNEGLPERVYAWRPDLRDNAKIRFIASNPPSLTRARNVAAANCTRDVVVFVDDDVIVDAGFVDAHLGAYTRNPVAIGCVGRIDSPADRSAERPVIRRRSVGQIRISGLIHAHFNTRNESTTIVAMTPMGANMSYRRERMNRVLGAKWFDETFSGSAFREETTTAIRLFRAGEPIVFEPAASLFHFEAIEGGCSNRAQRSLPQRISHSELDFLYLNHLYADQPLLRFSMPLWHTTRDLKWATSKKDRLTRMYVATRGFMGGRRLFGGSAK